jgi:uncharacterized Zn finger protein
MEDSMREELSIEVYKKGKKRPVVESEIGGDVEKRISRIPQGAIQLVWEHGTLVHVDCKNKDCGNNWTKEKNGEDYTSYFELVREKSGVYLVRCKICGAEHKSG